MLEVVFVCRPLDVHVSTIVVYLPQDNFHRFHSGSQSYLLVSDFISPRVSQYPTLPVLVCSFQPSHIHNCHAPYFGFMSQRSIDQVHYKCLMMTTMQTIRPLSEMTLIIIVNQVRADVPRQRRRPVNQARYHDSIPFVVETWA